jgi:2-C-methyl-D-erythritol 2,4-cyclodiphosphate synthase
MMRIGFGYDIHRLVPDRKLILGGVDIPFDKGLLGHSDADVVLHAIADAMLGAAALGDLGQHFPDTDPQFAGASSSDLLRHVSALLEQNNLALGNVDLTLIAQTPKLSPYREAMRENIATALGVEIENVSVKFTTHEGLGEIGRGEAMAAQAVVILNTV